MNGIRARRGRLAVWYGEYVRSLKAVEVEEVLDLVVYRPLAFLLTKVLLHTRATPNQVSLASLVCGVATGWLFWIGTPYAWVLAAVAYFACNTLDCADGQLARLRGGGTPLGYMIDGCIDYAASIAVFVGMAHGLEARRPADLSWWSVSAIAGTCYAWQCAILDSKRREWMHWVHGKSVDGDATVRGFREHAERYRREGGHWLDRVLIASYLAYHKLWNRVVRWRDLPQRSPARSEAWARHHRPALRMAIWLGPTTQMSLIMLSGVAQRPDLFLWATLTAGNALALLILLVQRRAVAGYEREAAALPPAVTAGA